ncbi:MAG TPA: pectinesterase family protein [Phycisphaerae bacterium]|jgi:pectinesterase
MPQVFARRLLAMSALLLSTQAFAAEGMPGQPAPDITVALDGSGNFKSVAAAMQSIPRTNSQRITVYVKDGLYNERVSVPAPFVTLLGQSRKNTRIEFNPNSESAPVIAVQGSDFILQNISVTNTGGNPQPHAVTISSSTADRVVFLDSDVLSTGADTVSLWKNDGRYYHARCNFRGSVDSVCPHGWCYAVDCNFFETRKDAVIWQDGKGSKEMKFVLKNCTFDGVEGFNLGRHHHDALFVLLDCTFSNHMIDKDIFRVIYPLDGGPPTAADIQNNKQHDPTNIWGERNYYYNSHRQAAPEVLAKDKTATADFAFHKNNLDKLAPDLKPEQITAAWTFAGSPNPWDPESKSSPTIKSVAAQDKQIAVTFSENVTVKGKPSLALADNSTATYAGGSGTTTLLFDTAAPAGKPKSLDLNNGFIFASQASATLRNADPKLP